MWLRVRAAPLLSGVGSSLRFRLSPRLATTIFCHHNCALTTKWSTWRSQVHSAKRIDSQSRIASTVRKFSHRHCRMSRPHHLWIWSVNQFCTRLSKNKGVQKREINKLLPTGSREGKAFWLRVRRLCRRESSLRFWGTIRTLCWARSKNTRRNLGLRGYCFSRSLTFSLRWPLSRFMRGVWTFLSKTRKRPHRQKKF
jgi:hypothetical protein